MTCAATGAALVAFAGNSLLCRLALRPRAMDPASFTAVRIVTGAIVLLGIAVWRRQRGDLAPWGGSWQAAGALFAYAAAFSFAYNELNAGTGALLLFGSVQVTMIIGAMVRGERPRAREWLALIIAASGLVVLVAPGLAAPPLGSAALMACAGCAWGCYSLLGRRTADPIAATTGNFARAGVFSCVLAVGFAANWHVETRGMILAMLSGGVTSALGYVTWYVALRGLAATRAALVQLSVPVLTAIGGVVLLAESFTAQLLIAAGLILGGVAVAVFGTRR